MFTKTVCVLEVNIAYMIAEQTEVMFTHSDQARELIQKTRHIIPCPDGMHMFHGTSSLTKFIMNILMMQPQIARPQPVFHTHGGVEGMPSRNPIARHENMTKGKRVRALKYNAQ